jgi:peptidyl-tRNA hydrolase
MDTKDYVLGKISKEENKLLEDVKNTIMNILDDYFELSFTELMSKYNHK